MHKRYDREYFERWYHDEETRISSSRELSRKVRMVVGIAEYLLDRPIRSVLDIGCGEGRWREHLERLRPAVLYAGIDTSEYVVERFGAERNIRLGSFGDLTEQDFDQSFDLVVCSDVLHYLPAREIDRGLTALLDLLDGVAYLGLFTKEDEPAGDLAGWYPRSAAWYRERFRRTGLVNCGMCCWVAPDLEDAVAALERGR